MQAVARNTDFAGAPRVYRNRPQSLALNSPRPEPLSDVLYLVEPDAYITKEITLCFTAIDVKVSTFSSAAEYLAFDRRDSAACVALDTHLPDMSGFELQRCLKDKGTPPVIFISDHCDVALAVRAMKAGAMEFLPKPIDLQALVTSVQAAFTQDRRLRLKKFRAGGTSRAFRPANASRA